MVLAVFPGSHSRLPFEDGLKVRLAGKTEVAADFGERLVGIAKQSFRIFELAPSDELGNAEAAFFPKFLCEVGAAFSDVGGDIVDSDGKVGMVLNELHARKNILGNIFWRFALRYPFREI